MVSVNRCMDCVYTGGRGVCMCVCYLKGCIKYGFGKWLYGLCVYKRKGCVYVCVLFKGVYKIWFQYI